jgi:glycogen synthase
MRSGDRTRIKVLRLCSVFEPPASALVGKGVGFDPIGGMQNHTAELTRALDRRGVAQTVVTTRPPTAPHFQRLGNHARVVRLGLPIRRPRQLYGLQASIIAPILASRADLVHVHLGEDLAVLPIGAAAAKLHRLPLALTVHMSMRHTLVVSNLRSAILKTLGVGSRGGGSARRTRCWPSRRAWPGSSSRRASRKIGFT